METAENWLGSDAMSVRKLVADRLWHRQRCRFGKPRTEACVRAPSIVQLDNATLIVLSFAKFVIRGIHGSVNLSPCTRH